MPDLTKLILHSTYPAFHQNNIYTGSVTIPATAIAGGGLISYSFNVSLDETPDLTEILFNGNNTGPLGTLDRPANGWFKPGMSRIVQGGTQSATPDQFEWDLATTITGNVLTITFLYPKQYIATFTPTAAQTVYYRVIDYSALG